MVLSERSSRGGARLVCARCGLTVSSARKDEGHDEQLFLWVLSKTNEIESHTVGQRESKE
jgi:hypothetical protein